MPKGARMTEDQARAQQGFSLIELSIMLIIMGLLVVPIFQFYDVYKENRDLRTTESSLNVVANALSEFLATEGRLPCPANPALPRNNANHGEEDCALATAPGFDFDGNGAADDYDGNGADDTIYTGSLPYVQLGINMTETLDAYGSKIMYAVSESMTRAGGVSTSWGSIQVQSKAYDEDTGVDVISNEKELFGDDDGSGRPDNDEAPPFGQIDDGLFHSVVFSTGRDKKGGYTVDGALVVPCNAANGADAENCDGDALFLTTTTYESPGANYFDDQVYYRLWSFGSLWSVDPGTDNIFNNNPGNVGINTASPQEKLHVSGNVRANEVTSDLVCHFDAGTGVKKCFQPSAIGGDNSVVGEGMKCASNEVMVGITNGGPDCQPVGLAPADLYGQNCGLGGGGEQLFLTGINADGTIQCTATP